MATPPLPTEDHVVRYVRKRLLRTDGEGNLVGVLPQAFELRPNENYLSVTWLQHFSSIYETGLKHSATAIRRQLTVKEADGFTVGQVGEIGSTCLSRGCRVRILHEPIPVMNTGHSAWRGLAADNAELLDLLAADVFTDTRLARYV
jgi:hypothetical protein